MVTKVCRVSGEACSRGFLEEAFDLYLKCYANISKETFMSDLKKVNNIFYIRAEDNRLVGFLAQNIIEIDGVTPCTIYCGSKTVVDKYYWGSALSSKLQYAWYKEAVKKIFLRPFHDFFIYAAPTGYKTYLLFVKLSLKRWPAYDSQEKQWAPLIEKISHKLYKDAYKPEEGLVHFGAEYIVTDKDARIDVLSGQEDPHILFFEKMNPGWREAKGLPVLVKIDFPSIFYFLFKKLKRILKIKKQPR